MYWDHMTGWGWVMMIFWAVIWIGLLGLGAWAISTWRSPAYPRISGDLEKTERDQLDERLVRGEITIEEYQRLRNAIEGVTRSGHA
jgi:uncharacterized membrane protein